MGNPVIRWMFRFNPRICKRCDYHLHPDISPHFGFNPRICKRCDLSSFCKILPSGFNPRICKRCDGAASSVGVKYNVSIHASVKDATSVTRKDINIVLFQSTHL